MSVVRRVRSVVIGYYGRWNLGDDLMARNVAAALVAAGREVCILTGDSYLADIVSGRYVRTAPRSGAGFLNVLVWCDELVLAGGTFFHDSYTDAEFQFFLRHLKRYAWLLRSARLVGKRVRLIGAGLGPLRRDKARRVARSALGAAHAVYVRDAASLAEAQAIGAGPVPVLGPDLAFLEAERLSMLGRSRAPENRLGLSLIDMAAFMSAEQASAFWAPVAQAVGDALKADLSLHLTLFAFWTAPGRRSDRPVAEAYSEALPAAVRERVQICAYAGNPDEVIDALAKCRAILATRFHAAVLAQALGRPYAVIAYNRKVADLADAHGLPNALRLPGDRLSAPEEVRAVLDALLHGTGVPTADAEAAAENARAAVSSALAGSAPAKRARGN